VFKLVDLDDYAQEDRVQEAEEGNRSALLLSNVSSHLCTDWSVVELRLLSLAPHPRTHLPLVEAQSEVHGLVNSGFCLLHLIPYMIFHLSFVADLEQTVRMGCLLHLSLAEFNSITPALCCKAQVNL